MSQVHDQHKRITALCKNRDYTLQQTTIMINDGNPINYGEEGMYIYEAVSSAARTGGSITSSSGFIAGNNNTSC